MILNFVTILLRPYLDTVMVPQLGSKLYFFFSFVSAWTMGWLVCKTIPYLQGVSVNASINTLVAISVERCLAICYPMRWQMTSRACKIIIMFIWIFSLTITLPWALFFQLQPLEEGSDIQVRIMQFFYVI